MKVTFSATHSVFAVKAPKDTLVSLSETPTQVEDGVYKIGDNGVVLIDEQYQTDSIYLSTAGSDYTVAKGERIATVAEGVEVWAGSSGVSCPFKVGGKGGGGSSGSCTYKGTTTTAIENGSTTNPITIDGEEYTAVFGDIVVYGYTEFVFDGTAWSEFGRPFDTTPTSGSANAVTSDGVYRRTPWTRGNPSNSAYIGAAMTVSSTAPNSIAVGYGCNISAEETAAFGFNTIANKNYMFVCGRGNAPRIGDLFNIGNSASATRSNIVEVNYTSLNVNGDIQKNGVSLPTPYTTMPTITATMLGQIAQYVGETTNDYVKGYFYIASSDGAAEPTYSWVNLPVSPRTYSETVLYDNTDESETLYPNTITLSDSVYNYDEIYVLFGKDGWCVEQSHKTSVFSKYTHFYFVGVYNFDAGRTIYELTANNTLTKNLVTGTVIPITLILGIKY